MNFPFVRRPFHSFLVLALLLFTGALPAFADAPSQWSAGSITSASLTGVAYGNGVFVAVGNNEVWTSPDGFNWTKSPSFAENISVSAVTFAEGVFVATGNATTPGFNLTIIITSADGKNWQTTESFGAVDGPLTHVVFVNNEFVAFGASDGEEGTYFASPDGYNWTGGGYLGGNSFIGLTYNNAQFIAAFGSIYNGETGVRGAVIAADADFEDLGTYEAIVDSFPGSTLFGIASGNIGTGDEATIAVGGAGLIAGSFYQTTNASSTGWITETSGTTNALEAIIFANGLFVAVGTDGTVLSSPDGSTWTTQNSGTFNFLSSVTYGNGLFVAVGTFGTVAVSAIRSPAAISDQPSNVTIAAGGFANLTVVAGGTPAPAYQWQISTNSGTTWSNITSGSFSGFTSASLVASNVTLAMSGDEFRVLVSNPQASVISVPATLIVTPKLFSFQTIDAPGAYSPQFYGTNANSVSGGNVVGYYYDSNFNAHGFIFNGTTYTILDDPNAAEIHGSGTAATGISDGNIVGWYLGNGNSPPQQGFLYNLATSSYSTLNDPAGVFGTVLMGVSDGNIVGWYYDESQILHSFLYNLTSGNYTTLADPAGVMGTFVYGVSSGNVVGYYTDDSNVNHGFLYNIATQKYTSFDDPDGETGPGAGTFAYGISGGNIVGYYSDNHNDSHGFLYNGTAYTTIDDPNANASYGTEATGIDGGNIVGIYYDGNGTIHGFLATAIGVSGNGGSGVAPTVTIPPADVLTVLGQSASFTVVASGTAPLKYQWYFNGNKISSATKATYTIAKTTLANAGNYTVFVSNSAGNVTSSAATLTVNTLPVITTSPASLTVTAGANTTAIFKVVTTGNPAPAIQWQSAPAKSTVFSNLSNGGDFSNVTTANLTVSTPDGSLSGTQFRAVATNLIGNTTSTATSKIATLTVDTPAAIANLTLTANGNTTAGNVTVSAGQSVTFTVTATGTPPPTYQWLLNGANIKGATKATYTIAKAAAANAGLYSVKVTNSLAVNLSGNFTLAVLTPPVIVTPLKATSAKVGTSPMLKVVASGNPIPVFTWSFGGSGLPSNSNITTSTNLNTVTSTLNFSNVTVSNTGTYKVVIINSQSPQPPKLPLSSSAKLTVK
jgi:hypothetical protein